MPLLDARRRAFLESITKITLSNPFLPERIEAERAALGADFHAEERVWSLRADRDAERANVDRILRRVEPTALALRDELARGAQATADELALYENLALFLLYHRYRMDLVEEVLRVLPQGEARGREKPPKSTCWQAFAADFARVFEIDGVELPSRLDAAHVFACFFQVRRAFHHVFSSIVGGSMPAARLRADVWRSIFTHDLRRYERTLWSRMGDVTTLVVGPSGTGKELVARAIAFSRYIPFDARSERFTERFDSSFLPLNVSALSPTLVESELFGHRRGAFTGAVEDHAGYFEACKRHGTVFLDEIAEAEPALQVKLLRVLQSRTFQRLGDTEEHRFEGKIVAATNRDLATEIERGSFRTDFYYRLCGDVIRTPSLAEQIADAPEELENVVRFLARHILPDDVDGLSKEVVAFIERELGLDYRWPGNMRELEQCIRNVMIRQRYEPARLSTSASTASVELAQSLDRGGMTADELLRRYCTLVYARTHNFVETAKLLDLDRRTVRAKVDRSLLAELGASVDEEAQ